MKMIRHSLQVIKLSPHEAVTAMSVRDLLDVAIPARNFLANAKLDPIERRTVDRMREIHGLIQRDFTGEKKRNANGDLADYIRDEWIVAKNGRPTEGFFGPFILFFVDDIPVVDGVADLTQKGIFGDGESRGEAFLVNIERLTDAEVERLLDRTVAVHLVHGIQDPKVLSKYFADVNGKGVRVNPNLVVMADYTDPYAEVSKRVFERLGFELETRQRQVGAASDAVMTGLQARAMVAAVARGVAAVQYGAKPIPSDGLDVDRLESAAQAWFARVFDRFEAGAFRDRSLILRAGPVGVCLGALGRSFYDGDEVEQMRSVATLMDERIDWTVGPHWEGLAGKTNPATGVFTVGGGKEYAYGAWAALTKPDDPAGRRIRHLDVSQEGGVA
jgi:hypothetical protein